MGITKSISNCICCDFEEGECPCRCTNWLVRTHSYGYSQSGQQSACIAEISSISPLSGSVILPAEQNCGGSCTERTNLMMGRIVYLEEGTVVDMDLTGDLWGADNKRIVGNWAMTLSYPIASPDVSDGQYQGCCTLMFCPELQSGRRTYKRLCHNPDSPYVRGYGDNSIVFVPTNMNNYLANKADEWDTGEFYGPHSVRHCGIAGASYPIKKQLRVDFDEGGAGFTHDSSYKAWAGELASCSETGNGSSSASVYIGTSGYYGLDFIGNSYYVDDAEYHSGGKQLSRPALAGAFEFNINSSHSNNNDCMSGDYIHFSTSWSVGQWVYGDCPLNILTRPGG